MTPKLAKPSNLRLILLWLLVSMQFGLSVLAAVLLLGWTGILFIFLILLAGAPLSIGILLTSLRRRENHPDPDA